MFSVSHGAFQCTFVLRTLLLMATIARGSAVDDNLDRDCAEAVARRMDVFELTVCSKCILRNASCGCELGDANPPFELLRSYTRLYRRWQTAAWKGGLQDQAWVLVDVEGGAGNQLIHVVGALTLALSLGRPLVLNHNTVLSFPFDPVIRFFQEDELIQQGVMPPVTARNASSAFLLNVFSAAGVRMLSCGDWREELAGFQFVKFQGAYGVHLPLINPFFGDWLHKSFHGLPFFFLSHFLWSGHYERKVRPVRIFSVPPQPWDKLYDSMAEFADTLRQQYPRAPSSGAGASSTSVVIASVHVRTDTNHPMYYFDQRHLLPDRPHAFCGGHVSR